MHRNKSNDRQIDPTVIQKVEQTFHNSHKINAERLLNFTKAKQNLCKLADLKKTNLNDITPNFIPTSEKKSHDTKDDSISSVKPVKLKFESTPLK